jgi:hypothetical protein
MVLVQCKNPTLPTDTVRSGDPVPPATEYTSGSCPRPITRPGNPIPQYSHSIPSTADTFPSTSSPSTPITQTGPMPASLSSAPSSRTPNHSELSTSPCAQGPVGCSNPESPPTPSQNPNVRFAADNIPHGSFQDSVPIFRTEYRRSARMYSMMFTFVNRICLLFDPAYLYLLFFILIFQGGTIYFNKIIPSTVKPSYWTTARGIEFIKALKIFSVYPT